MIGFVSNGSFIDSQTTDGLRKSLYEEFNHLYIFNLRGDQRTQGETSRKEGGKIFGSGSRTPIAISILIKDGSDNHEVHYHDIGDYLTRDNKLDILREKESIANITWKRIIPDQYNDWINQRNNDYKVYPAMAGDIFEDWAVGVSTNRDAWVVNFDSKQLTDNVNRLINKYNAERNKLANDIDEQIIDRAFYNQVSQILLAN